MSLKPSALRVLHALEDGPKTTAQLCQPEVGGIRFGARLQELRDAGWEIVSTPLRPGSYRYRLIRARAEIHAVGDGARESSEGSPPGALATGDPGTLFELAEHPRRAVLEDWDSAA